MLIKRKDSQVKAETKFRKIVVKWIRVELKNVDLTSIQQCSILGTPDLFICLNGHFIAAEIKSKDGKLSELQYYKLKKIREKGKGRTLLIDPETWPEVQKILTEIDQGECSWGNGKKLNYQKL